MFIDHLVISVSNLKASTKFYSYFLGKAKVSKLDAHWVLGNTKLFLTFPYKKSTKKFDKHNLGLNHIAFRLKDLAELKRYEKKLDHVNIQHSGILIDEYSKKEFLWFNDPDGIRLEFYLR